MKREMFFLRIMSRFQPVNHGVFSRVELSFSFSSSSSSSSSMPFSFSVSFFFLFGKKDGWWEWTRREHNGTQRGRERRARARNIDECERRTCQRVCNDNDNDKGSSYGECGLSLQRMFNDRIAFPSVFGGPRYSLLTRRHRRMLHKRLNSVVLKVSPRVSLRNEDDLFMLKLSPQRRRRRRREEEQEIRWGKGNGPGACQKIITKKENIRTIDSLYRRGERVAVVFFALSLSRLLYTMTRNVRSSSCFFSFSFSSQAAEQCICW